MQTHRCIDASYHWTHTAASVHHGAFIDICTIVTIAGVTLRAVATEKGAGHVDAPDRWVSTARWPVHGTFVHVCSACCATSIRSPALVADTLVTDTRCLGDARPVPTEVCRGGQVAVGTATRAVEAVPTQDATAPDSFFVLQQITGVF